MRDKAGEGHFDGVTVQPMIRDGAYELILGSSIDSQLGPVLLFGWGGQLVEVFRDRALGALPFGSHYDLVQFLAVMNLARCFGLLVATIAGG